MTDTITLKNSDGLDVEFIGTKLGVVHSRVKDEQRRWTELALYRAASDRYICHQIGRTIAPNEIDIFKVHTAAEVADVVAFFGTGWLSKKLYEQCNIQAREFIS